MKTITGKVVIESAILSCSVFAWLISFIYIYLPTSGFIKQDFLLNIDFTQKLTFFLISTTIASCALLIKGIQLLRKPKHDNKPLIKKDETIFNSN